MVKAIRKRNSGKNLMQLAIAQNPWSKDPKKLWDSLQTESGSQEIFQGDELDHTGVKKLKSLIKR